MAPSPSLLKFVGLIRRPNRRHGVPPHVPPQSRVLLDSPSIEDADFHLIVACKLINGGRPKAKASPPLRSIFRSLSFRPPKRANRRQRPNPDGSRTAHGLGEWWRRDWMAPPLYPRRERTEKTMGVGRMAAARVGCCVLCILC